MIHTGTRPDFTHNIYCVLACFKRNSATLGSVMCIDFRTVWFRSANSSSQWINHSPSQRLHPFQLPFVLLQIRRQ